MRWARGRNTVLPEVMEIDGGDFEALFCRWAHLPHTARLQGGWDVHGMGRFSYLGFDPYQRVTFEGSTGRVVQAREEKLYPNTDPFELLAQFYRPLQRRERRNDVPFAFQGGAIGFLGYGLRRFCERVGARTADDLGMPDLYMAFYDLVAVYDHLQERAYLVSNGLPLSGDEAMRRAKGRLDEAARALLKREGVVEPRFRPPASGVSSILREERSAFDRRSYRQAVLRAKEYIAAGDVYQVNLAQRFSVPFSGDATALFEAVRTLNPAPFSALIQGETWAVVSASPERFLHFDGVRVQTRPIKGTRPRAEGSAEDEALRAELLQSSKDRAEHVMIVDLERNDLGRFCRYGSVRVPELMVCEAHPTVWHLVSTVEGEPVEPGAIVDALRSAFPGGSITGAPKVRAMEIIDELEPVSRGVYTGSIGYFGLGNQIDLNIAIRTICLAKGVAAFHVGGGIVADSDPEAEYQETLDKGLGLARALASLA